MTRKNNKVHNGIKTKNHSMEVTTMGIVEMAIKGGLAIAALAFGGQQICGLANGVKDNIKSKREKQEQEPQEEETNE